MKILLVNTFDRGGAANSCLRLHSGLLKKGIDSKVLLRIKSSNTPSSFAFTPRAKKLSRLEKLENKIKIIGKELKIYTPALRNEKIGFLNRRPEGLEMFSCPQTGIDITPSSLYKDAEIVNLHWVANFLDYELFFKKNKKPVVWTLHDMNAFSGGEHYTENFLGMDDQGNPIPRTLTEEEREIETANLEIKKTALAQVQNLTLVAPSNWIAAEAQKSDLFRGRPIHVIPYGLDSQTFTIRDKNFSRDILGIPRDKIVLLFVADSINNQRKGFHFLKRAIAKLEDKDLVLCSIGDNNSLEVFPNVIELGVISDDRLMSMAYSAVDAFVIPSLMDNLPNTVVESLMCGTPVMGFPAGGIPEMIQNGKNGFLTEEISVNSLVKTLENFLANPARFDREKIGKEALNKYDENIQAENYIKLFKSILKN